MGRMILAALAVFLLLSGPAVAQQMTEKQKCAQAVADVRNVMENESTPGEKARKRVEELLEISTHLCEQANFRYAETLLQLARTMVASE